MLVFAHLALGLLGALLSRSIVGPWAGSPWLWMFGAVLPDLLDKPLSMVVPGFDAYTRGIGHTLVFAVLLVALGQALPEMRAVGLGALTHLVADGPWTYWQTFLWPLRGIEFQKGSAFRVEDLWERMQQPGDAVLEILGALFVVAGILVWVAGRASSRRATESDAARVVGPAVRPSPGPPPRPEGARRISELRRPRPADRSAGKRPPPAG